MAIYNLYWAIAYVFAVAIGLAFFAFILVRIVIGVKFDRLFRHVRVPGYYGPELLRSFFRSTLYAYIIVGGDERMIRKRKALMGMFNNYQFRKHANQFEIALSYSLVLSGITAFASSALLLLMHLIYNVQ